MTTFRVRRKGGTNQQSGYMLLFLMLAVAVLTITMLGVARNYRRGIQRDREVEMIHRGEQYARAVRRFYRKNGRYPTTLEQLENTNQIRYLRKRYKDPMSPDGEWKLVHLTDVKLKSTGGLTASGIGATPTSGTGAPGSTATASAFGQSTAGSTFGASTSNPNTDSNAVGSNAAGATSGTNSANTAAGTNTSTSATDTNAANPAGSAANGAGPVLGGGAILGVVSKMKDQGIHSFGDKSKYNEWFFIYDPAQDTGQGLIVGPYNPNMFMGGSAGLGNSNKSTSGTGTSNTGTSNGSTPNSGTTTNSPATTPSPTTTPQ